MSPLNTLASTESIANISIVVNTLLMQSVVFYARGNNEGRERFFHVRGNMVLQYRFFLREMLYWGRSTSAPDAIPKVRLSYRQALPVLAARPFLTEARTMCQTDAMVLSSRCRRTSRTGVQTF